MEALLEKKYQCRECKGWFPANKMHRDLKRNHVYPQCGHCYYEKYQKGKPTEAIHKSLRPKRRFWIQCLKCEEYFWSWNRKKNRICPCCDTQNKRESLGCIEAYGSNGRMTSGSAQSHDFIRG